MKQRATIGTELNPETLALVQGGGSPYLQSPFKLVREVGREVAKAAKRVWNFFF